MRSAERLWEHVAGLVEVLGGRGLRLVARPSWVMLDRAAGPVRVETAWTDEEHRAVLDILAEVGNSWRFASGHTVTQVGGTLVLRRPPDPLRRIDDLVSEGWVSPLAGRVLGAASGLGRNVLLVGPATLCADIAAAILAEGERPALVGGPTDATPTAWPLLQDGSEARLYGADRIGAWSLDTAALQTLMSGATGVVGWADARRLDKALIRFENATAGGPMSVLASIDLMVAVSDQPSPRVREVAEIVLTEDGYRPLTLFACGLPPVPTALVPVASPTFIDELAQSGQTVLADDLRHAVVAQAPQAAPHSAPQAQSRAVVVAPTIEEAPEPVVERGPSIRVVPPEPQLDRSLDDAPPPGWELDQLADDELEHTAPQEDPEAAVMAATFGLAPPPRPANVAPDSPNPYAGTFANALDRARERDAELRAELGDQPTDSGPNDDDRAGD